MQLRARAVDAWSGFVVMAAVASCGSTRPDATDTSQNETAALAPSPVARNRIKALRDRFRMTVSYDRTARGSERSRVVDSTPPRARPDALTRLAKPAPIIGIGVATAFEPSDIQRESVRVRIPSEAKHGSIRTASVELPSAAAGFVELEDDSSHLSVRFALLDATNTPLAVADGIALYAGAVHGADIVHRAHAEGTEDFVVFAERPAREELTYAVDVTRVAGLRLVSDTLEFLDDAGTPRLRVASPYVIDADNERHDARLAVDGCSYDSSPAAPWGRPVTHPGAAQCAVLVSWKDVPYPAVVDPAWTATGSMTHGRSFHTASVLASGNVLMAGGGPTAAELYEPATGTFSSTGSMTQGRSSHTASVLESGEVLVVGGGPSSSAELYDPKTGTFSPTGSMTEARDFHTASVLGSGKVLVTGGSYVQGLATAEIYDPTAGTFSPTGSMAETRWGHTASVLGSGKVLVVGGGGSCFVGCPVRATAELYEPLAGTFSSTGSMAGERLDHTASVLGSGKVLVVGGDYGPAGSLIASAELYDPGAGTFSATGSMADARGSHSASLLGSGKVLVVGGSYDSYANAELYDPTVDTFSATDPMLEGRVYHTASVLGSGKVLVAGGSAHPGASAELYDLDAADMSDSGTDASNTDGSGTGGSATDASNTGGSGTGGSNTGGSSTGGSASADSGDDDGGCGCATARTSSRYSLLVSLALLLVSLGRPREPAR